MILLEQYIDILYLHWWDHTTSIEEVMHALHALVLQGKVLYLGIRSAPARIFPLIDLTCALPSSSLPFDSIKLTRRDLSSLLLSDTPAWVVSEANTYAKLQGLTPFVICMRPMPFISLSSEFVLSNYLHHPLTSLLLSLACRPRKVELHDSRFRAGDLADG